MPGHGARETLKCTRTLSRWIAMRGDDIVILDRMTHGRRAVIAAMALRAVALLGLGVWGAVKLTEGDWFIGGVLVASVLLGLHSLVMSVRHRSSPPADRTSK
jgi:hypothetical protein